MALRWPTDRGWTVLIALQEPTAVVKGSIFTVSDREESKCGGLAVANKPTPDNLSTSQPEPNRMRHVFAEIS